LTTHVLPSGGKPPIRWGVAAIAAGLVAAGVLGIWLILRFVEAERTRDMAAWQIRLGLVVDGRAVAIDDWVDAQHAALRDLAQNAALQLYMTERALAAGDPAKLAEAEAHAGYLRTLLSATADATGFAPVRAPAPVAANVSRAGGGGLALVDAQGNVVAASAHLPPLDARLRAFLAGAATNQRALLDLYLGADGEPTLGFAAPVFGIQADHGSQALGVVFGIRPTAGELARRLVQPGETLRTGETVLVRSGDGGRVVEYLTPWADGTPALRRSLAMDTPNLAAAYALANPGGFAERVDHDGRAVLVTARRLANAPWTVMRTVTMDEALEHSLYRGRVLLLSFLGGMVLIAVVIVGVWRHGIGLRASAAAERYRALAERFEYLSSFMRVVADAQPTAIAAVDRDDRITFANAVATRVMGGTEGEPVGKKLAAVLGQARAQPLAEGNARARVFGATEVPAAPFANPDGAERLVKAAHMPLPLAAEPGSVLMVLEDVTELEQARLRRERALGQLVDTLVSLVDRRDPWSAHHSLRTADVARAVAEEIGLPAVDVATARNAAALMNMGKILVPDTVLTKTGKLSDDEMRQVRDGLAASPDLIAGIDFDGPVAETLRQLPERWDGAGPRGLRGDDILLSARIVAVANAFVAMVSSRAWRAGLPLDDAARQLLADAGSRYDRRVVIALVNILDNRGGRDRWTSFGTAPDSA
jgi:PAS domain S-box-containing protein